MSLPPEEQGRANFYGLISRLFYAAPDADLLAALGSADELQAHDEALASSWRELQRAAARADVEAVREEYETTFVGTGKAPVTLYIGAYSARYSNEVPLAQLKADLVALGFARRIEAGEPEDHIAALCDVMRHLIAQPRSLEEQKRFFERWLEPHVESLCAAIDNHERTSFYRLVGRLAKAFFSLEQSAFEML
jgi:TorA maturation chaperone TorD